MAQHFNQQVAATDAILFKLRCYRDPQRIRLDVLEALRNYPSLHPREGSPSRAQGGQQVLFLAGTLPIWYNTNQYNIPINIWVVDAYPLAPPVIYVTPTPDMVIKPKHRHVDSTGMVYLPYLSTWNATSCNILNLASVMSQIFGQDPPVRAISGPSSSTPQIPTQPPPQPPSQPSSQPSSQPQSYGQPSQPYENPAVVAQRNAMQQTTIKLQNKLHEYYSATTKDIDDLMVKSSSLEEKGRSIEQMKSLMESEFGQSDSEVSDLTVRFDEVSKWLEQNEGTNSSINIDAITEPKDPLSKQLLSLVAEDATIEDTIYYLEKSLGRGDVSVEEFLKTLRGLSVDQFVKRATIKKVHEKQRAH